MLAAALIVAAIATRITGLSLAGDDVFTSRAWPLAEKDLPAWRVIAADEEIEPLTLNPNPLQKHTLQVELHGIAQVTAALDDALHALTAEALAAVFRTSGTADDLDAIAPQIQVSLRRIERTFSKEGEAATGLALITLRVDFKTRAAAPETLI
jgi:hypothetical protein